MNGKAAGHVAHATRSAVAVAGILAALGPVGNAACENVYSNGMLFTGKLQPQIVAVLQVACLSTGRAAV